jgi:hypothetical protein
MHNARKSLVRKATYYIEKRYLNGRTKIILKKPFKMKQFFLLFSPNLYHSHVFLLGLRQVVGQVGGVILVDFGRDFVEPGDEGVLDPVNQKFGAQNQKAVGSK